MAKYKVRAARAEETAELTEIARKAKAYWGYDETLIELWDGDLSLTAEYLKRHAVFCAVEKADNVVGVYALSGEPPVVELDHMWVIPAKIGAGVGQVLFDHAVKTAKSKSAKKIQIIADPNAEGFYLRMGARRIGTIDSRPSPRKLPLLEYHIAEKRQ